jgi:hypothetical protein
MELKSKGASKIVGFAQKNSRRHLVLTTTASQNHTAGRQDNGLLALAGLTPK